MDKQEAVKIIEDSKVTSVRIINAGRNKTFDTTNILNDIISYAEERDECFPYDGFLSTNWKNDTCYEIVEIDQKLYVEVCLTIVHDWRNSYEDYVFPVSWLLNYKTPLDIKAEEKKCRRELAETLEIEITNIVKKSLVDDKILHEYDNIEDYLSVSLYVKDALFDVLEKGV